MRGSRLEADEGFGQPRDDLFAEIPRENFPGETDIQPGMEFSANGPNGTVRFQVTSVNEETVTADLNHPLAGGAFTSTSRCPR